MTVKEFISIDQIIGKALILCDNLPKDDDLQLAQTHINELHERLGGGKLRIAVLGQFNRGKSTFINSLLKMNLLPTSVLPLTSVPTVINFGHKNSCIISFYDGQNDAIIEGNNIAIANHLSTYVSEENNPQNKFCVKEANVFCNSKLLQHGTVIIDTPGFGSTHIHNTATTTNLLSNCDAALFLLSADLPITQVELDFLKQVIPTIPRLFFIYNKRDLLSECELKKTEKFISHTLSETLGLPDNTRLFPVTAKIVVKENVKKDTWKNNGLKDVEKHIIKFLIQDKYFTLSEALNAKFRDALNRIDIKLNQKLDNLKRPLDELKKEICTIETVTKNTNKEYKNSIEFAKSKQIKLIKYIKEKKCGVDISIIKSGHKYIDEHIDTFSTQKKHYGITTTLMHLINEQCSNQYLFIVTELNKRLRKTAIVQTRNFASIIETTYKTIKTDKSIPETSYDSAIDKLQLELLHQWDSGNAEMINEPTPNIYGIFSSKAKRKDRLVKHYLTELDRIVPDITENLSLFIEKKIDTIFSKFIETIQNDYTNLILIISKKQERLQKKHNELYNISKHEISSLETLQEAFYQTGKMLVE